MNVAYFSFFYGAMTVLGGLMGFLKAGSKASLIAGGVSGLLILVTAAGMFQGSMGAYYGLMAVTVLLAVYFGKGFASTRKLMPAGLMVLLSLLNLIGLLLYKQ